MTKDELVALAKKVKGNLRITKVVCTRSVKGRNGDTFAGFSAAYNSVQEDGARGLDEVMEEGDSSNAVGAMSFEEAMVASIILGREADLSAHNNALAGGNISNADHRVAIAAIKANYHRLMMGLVTDPKEDNKPKEENGKPIT